jgi:hypothetical protein
MNDAPAGTRKRPRVYFHKVKKRKQGFQRQDPNAVRARAKVSSKARYKADPEAVKAINAACERANPERHREHARKSRQRNLARTLERERQSWKRNRTPEKLAKMRAYSRVWRLRKRSGGPAT